MKHGQMESTIDILAMLQLLEMTHYLELGILVGAVGPAPATR